VQRHEQGRTERVDNRIAKALQHSDSGQKAYPTYLLFTQEVISRRKVGGSTCEMWKSTIRGKCLGNSCCLSTKDKSRQSIPASFNRQERCLAMQSHGKTSASLKDLNEGGGK
jgi:hypothetical protein